MEGRRVTEWVLSGLLALVTSGIGRGMEELAVAQGGLREVEAEESFEPVSIEQVRHIAEDFNRVY